MEEAGVVNTWGRRRGGKGSDGGGWGGSYHLGEEEGR